MSKITRRELFSLTGSMIFGSALLNCRSAPENHSVIINSREPVITPQGRTLPSDAAPLEKQILFEPAAEPRHLDISRDIYGAGVAINWGGEPLLRRDQNQNLVPAMAESFQMGERADYWDFTIRKDARWSDGVPITADDWVFTFRHLASPNLDNPWTWFYYDIKGIQALKEGKGRPEDVGVEAIDERTVRIWGEGGAILHLPALMAYQAAVPAPKHKAENNPEHWADTVEGFVSSGPMRLLSWQYNQQLEWDANPFYNGPHKVGIQKLIQLVGAPAIGWFNSWLNKEIDYIGILQPQELAQVVNDNELIQYLHTFNNFQTEYLSLDCLRPPFDNLKLRQALSNAIYREPFCSKVMLGTRIPAFSMLPPDFPAHNPELKSVQDFNVEKAKALLAEAGFPNGKDASGNQLVLDMFSNGRDVALEYVKDQWERYLDISVNLQIVETAVWGARRSQHAMPIYRGQYEYDFLDPANMLTRLWRSTGENGSPRHAWRNAKFDELVGLAGREIDEQNRINLYQQAERTLVEDVGGIFLAHMVTHQVWYPYLTGFEPDKNGNTVFRYLDISRFQMYIRNDVDHWRTSG
ncbi:MAG: peptide ABC transporter substrate-binding protein [Acidobacteria bacterium]|nr:peptide ABC transporter substrate-binding protein [Acidobacteriota bacterium]MCA1638657.1 peptide ABC transporter substrate-binding protein [Acidobacteriota bacterium]